MRFFRTTWDTSEYGSGDPSPLGNYPRNSHFNEDLEESDDQEWNMHDKLMLAFVLFPLVVAEGMVHSSVAGASLLGFWLCLRIMARSQTLTTFAIQEIQELARLTKEIWAAMAPDTFTMKCHWFFEHGMREEMLDHGTMYQWSSSPFESLHRRLQIKLHQSTTNSAAAMIERYLLNKKMRYMFNEACEKQNAAMISFRRRVDNKQKNRFPVGVAINPRTYIPKGSRVDPCSLQDEHRALIAPQDGVYSRLVIDGKVFSSRTYWKRTRHSRQDIVYLNGRDGAEEIDTFASIILFLFDRNTLSVTALLDEFICCDPLRNVENLTNSTQHACQELGLQILNSVRRNNTFFLRILEQTVRERPVSLIRAPSASIEIEDRSYASRL
ncbi:hypothetical protein ANCCAN_16577 [Ancylostoma caninum]|uniref:Uncharacterized protein n=1 Tax=Ancylostoma caninum TaxID=29170 RepID=A0A368FZ99_ANCCA|nr:hypothetical protein ANCCAN_16577 [Ancylostoma caninum]